MFKRFVQNSQTVSEVQLQTRNDIPILSIYNQVSPHMPTPLYQATISCITLTACICLLFPLLVDNLVHLIAFVFDKKI